MPTNRTIGAFGGGGGSSPGAYSPPRPPISAYIVNILTGSQHLINILPDSITESYSAMFDNIPIMGASSPKIGYSGGGPKSVSLSLPLHDDYSDKGILYDVNILKALAYPEYTTSIKPPNCYLRIGSFIAVYGACGSVSVSWQRPYRRDRSGNIVYVRADVSLDFQNIVRVPFSASDVERGRDTDAYS